MAGAKQIGENLATLEVKLSKAISKGKEAKARKLKRRIAKKKAAAAAAAASVPDKSAQPAPNECTRPAPDGSTWSLTSPPATQEIEGGAVAETRAEETGNTTILLFYQYVSPVWSKEEQDEVIKRCFETIKANGVTGRLRVAREGLNATLTGPHDGIRGFTSFLRDFSPHFANTDFKYVDHLPDKQMLKGIKVWPVTELVTYGVSAGEAHIRNGGTHLSAEEYHKMMEKDPKATVMIDVRNYNESLIGKFAPPGVEVLDPEMRRSTEFPEWVDNNLNKLKGKNVLMYCTGGIRCERASALLTEKGLDKVYQLEGGIHKYLEEFKEDGGHWIGKNYTFDKRFAHGAQEADVISKCVHCGHPWERYNAQKKCYTCQMEVLVCRTCMRSDKPPAKHELKCPLCAEGKAPTKDVSKSHGAHRGAGREGAAKRGGRLQGGGRSRGRGNGNGATSGRKGW